LRIFIIFLIVVVIVVYVDDEAIVTRDAQVETSNEIVNEVVAPSDVLVKQTVGVNVGEGR